MHRVMRLLGIGAALAAITACDESPAGTGGAAGSGGVPFGNVCVPGELVSCSCFDGTQGVHQCFPNGQGFGQCLGCNASGIGGGSTMVVVASAVSTGGMPCTPDNCSTCPGMNECVACCDDAHPAESAAATKYGIQFCICGLGAPCLAACSADGGPPDVCADPTAVVSSACLVCMGGLTDQDPCIQSAIDACSNDMGCAPVMQCYGGCP